MKPTKVQCLFASRWLGPVCGWGITLFFGALVGRVSAHELYPLSSWGNFGMFIGFVFCGLVLGYCVAILFFWLVLGPLCYCREIANGGPFEVGDTVEILSGPHKGRISRVYAVGQGGQTRVEVSPEVERQGKDSFSSLQLLMVRKAGPPAAPTSEDAKDTDDP